MNPDWLHTSADSDHIDVLAILIQAIDEQQRHVGLLHRYEDGPVRALELQWHHRLRNDPPQGSYLWVSPSLTSESSRSIAALCRLIWKKHEAGGLPYAFRYENACFDRRTGELLLGASDHGLTCATFVLAVFHTLGIRLLAMDTWPSRDEDRAWQERVLASLRRRPGCAAHADLLEKNLGCLRFRPEEVAGAAASPMLPVDFEQAADAAQHIVQAIQR